MKDQYKALNDMIFEFQKQTQRLDIASMDPAIRAAMESVEAQLDALRQGKLYDLR
jgi:hypothetical protein